MSRSALRKTVIFEEEQDEDCGIIGKYDAGKSDVLRWSDWCWSIRLFVTYLCGSISNAQEKAVKEA